MLHSQIDSGTIEFGIITHDGERNTSIYSTTLTRDSFLSWFELKISLSKDGFIFEIEVFGQVIGFEILSIIEEDEWDDED
jgi:hypothetical protein